MAARPHAARSARSIRWRLALAATIAPLVLLVPALRVGRQAVVEQIADHEGTGQPPLLHRERLVLDADDSVAVSEMIRTFAGVPQSASNLMTETMVLLRPDDLSDPDDIQPSGPALWRGRLVEQLEPWGRELSTAFDAFLESVSDPPPPESSRFDTKVGVGGRLAV